MGSEHLSSTPVMPKARKGTLGHRAGACFCHRFTTPTEAPRWGLWFSQAQMETDTAIPKRDVSHPPPPCTQLQAHSPEGSKPRPQNCHDSISFVRPANPPIHKKGCQLNLGFLVTFLAS